VIDHTGDGKGHGLIDPESIAVDSHGRIYVAGLGSDNVFKIILP